MTDTKISDLAAKATPAASDLLVIVDISDTTMGPAGSDKQATVGSMPYAGLGATNTFTASQAIYGTVTVVEPGGTIGTTAVAISHDGTNGSIAPLSGSLLLGRSGAGGARTDANYMFISGEPAQAWFYFSGFFVNGGATFNFCPGSGSSVVACLSNPATGVVGVCGASATAPGTIASVPLTPTTLAASVNNWALAPALKNRISASSAVNVTGLVAGQAGEIRHLWNVGSNTITFTNQDALSAAANQFLTTTGASLALSANQCAFATYDATTAAWRVSLLP